MIKFDPTFSKRPLSPSNVNSFLYNKETWYDTYILNKRQSSKEMDFGSMVDKKLETDPTYLPQVPRYPIKQKEMKAVFDKIYLIGKFDGLDLDNPTLADYKTGVKAWDQNRIEDCLQLKFYLLLLYINTKIPPEKFKCIIHWIPTKKEETGDFIKTISFRDDPVVPITFETRFTMQDILLTGQLIKKTIKEMSEYVHNHPLQSSNR